MPQYNALADRPSNMLAYPDAVRATPRNEYLGALADLVANSIAINDPAIKNEEHYNAKI